MSTQTRDSTAQPTEKKTVAGVSFSGTDTGKLDESAIPNDDYKSHYLYPEDSKSDSSYPVVSAEGNLMRGNVESAHQLGARGGVDEDTHRRKLKKLNDEFDNPPIDFDNSDSGKQAFEKHAEIAKVDADRNVVIGVAMEPDTVDTQGDFERGDTIESLSEGYMERLASGDAKSGVMHVSFPSQNVLSHVENRVLTQSETIGDAEYPAGTWQIGVKVRDETLQRLINSDTLTGFSIGGYVHETDHYDADDLPDDVRIDDEIRELAAESGEPIREITDATIHEISLVDVPAVQRAQIQTAKGDGLAKGAAPLTESAETATQYLIDRGHDPDPARELAEFLNREKSATASDGSASWLQRAKRFFSREEGTHDTETNKTTETTKGAVLSEENVARGMALHDISLDLLGTEIDHGRQTFAGDPSVDFAGVAFVQPEDSGGSGTVFDAQQSADTGGSGTGRDADADPTDDPLENMSDEETNEVLERLEDLESKFEDDDDAQTDEKDADADTSDESSESVERLEELESKFEQQAEAQARTLELLEQMASAQGVSQQADTSTGNGTEKGTWNDSPFAKRAGGD